MTILTLDAGGTAIKYAIFHGKEMGMVSVCPSHASEGGPRFYEEICRVIDSCRPFEHIALSVTGQVDPMKGSITYANTNVPHFTGTPLRQLLQERYHVPVTVENDVIAATLGEAELGAGQGFTNFLCLTYGTGVGCALLLNGALYRGQHGLAGGAGYMRTHMDDRGGSYEKYACTGALVRRAALLRPEITDGKTFFSALREGDENLSSILNLWIDEVALGLVSLIYILDPACVALGGGIMQEPGLVERIRKRCLPLLTPDRHSVIMKPAQLGSHAGLYGIYLLAAKGD